MHRLGVCSWSLRPKSPADLLTKLEATGLRAIQLALDPIRTGRWREQETVAALTAAGVTVLSGMMEMADEDYSTLESIRATGGLRPDATWAKNRAAAAENAVLARRLGIRLVSFHAGFLPHDHNDAERGKLLERLRVMARIFAKEGIGIALETGQETAATLLPVLTDLAPERVGVNFDPANMILYGMGDPVEALEELGPFVRQVHVKDATPAPVPLTWGTEVPAGKGSVAWKRFFTVLARLQPNVDLAIEREAGDQRVEDVRAAKALVERNLR